MERVGEHPVPAGPLAVRWLAYEAAGLSRRFVKPAVEVVLRERRHRDLAAPAASSASRLSYHWLDDRGNAIVWDGPRVDFGGPVAPGDEIEVALRVRAPQPPGRYRLAFDLLEELRFWFAEVGSQPLELDAEVLPRLSTTGDSPSSSTAATTRRRRRRSRPRRSRSVEDDAVATAYLVAGAIPEPDWSRRILDAHAEGFAAVGGSIESPGARARGPGRPVAAATRLSRIRCSCRRC